MSEMTLQIARCQSVLRVEAAGRLSPWVGAAVRGVLARSLKNAVCQHAEVERERDWRYCRGCSLLADCPYGATFEPDPPADRQFLKKIQDGVRAITVTQPFPAPERVTEGQTLVGQLQLVGSRAVRHRRRICSHLHRHKLRLGHGANIPTLSMLLDDHWERHTWGSAELTKAATSTGDVECRLTLQTPLMLKKQDGRVIPPQFADLLRGCLRIVGRSFAELGTGRLEGVVDFAEQKRLAGDVAMLDESWQLFGQRRRSNRQRRTYNMGGVTGSAVYRVPAPLLPWLAWGGQLGVGEHRVAGAGRWTLTTCSGPEGNTTRNRPTQVGALAPFALERPRVANLKTQPSHSMILIADIWLWADRLTIVIAGGVRGVRRLRLASVQQTVRRQPQGCRMPEGAYSHHPAMHVA